MFLRKLLGNLLMCALLQIGALSGAHDAGRHRETDEPDHRTKGVHVVKKEDP